MPDLCIKEKTVVDLRKPLRMHSKCDIITKCTEAIYYVFIEASKALFDCAKTFTRFLFMATSSFIVFIGI